MPFCTLLEPPSKSVTPCRSINSQHLQSLTKDAAEAVNKQRRRPVYCGGSHHDDNHQPPQRTTPITITPTTPHALAPARGNEPSHYHGPIRRGPVVSSEVDLHVGAPWRWVLQPRSSSHSPHSPHGVSPYSGLPFGTRPPVRPRATTWQSARCAGLGGGSFPRAGGQPHHRKLKCETWEFVGSQRHR